MMAGVVIIMITREHIALNDACSLACGPWIESLDPWAIMYAAAMVAVIHVNLTAMCTLLPWPINDNLGPTRFFVGPVTG